MSRGASFASPPRGHMRRVHRGAALCRGHFHIASLPQGELVWHLDANVPCGRAGACCFAMLVLRCPASEKAALHSWPDNASLACLQYCIVHFSFLQTVTNVEFADLFSFLFPLLSFLHISSLGCPRISCILLFPLRWVCETSPIMRLFSRRTRRGIRSTRKRC